MTKSLDLLSESRSAGDYLKAVYALGGAEGVATTGAIAERLEVAPPSVTNMLQKLSSRRPPLVRYSKRGGARLTESGRRMALEMMRRHRLIERFLHEVLGYGWEEVHAEAEKLEHVISEEMADRIARRLGDPVFDPHGDPIPGKDGSLPERAELRLADLEIGARAIVARVPDRDPSVLLSIARVGLLPGVSLEVARAGRGRALVVRLPGARRVRIVPRVVAEMVRVVETRPEDAGPAVPSSTGRRA
ncbi:MAG: metal-dependent transcriptional regulator [Candidatus Latescibacterota bacterium]|nr:MAG: metal-dependent transcriptional regulator [Candidatus Latescibacterota bacterium]